MSQASTVVDDDLASSQTLHESSSVPGVGEKLDLGQLPPIFVSATQIDTEDLHELEEQLVDSGANLTYDVAEARIVLTKVEKVKRIAFDMRAKGLWTEEAKLSDEPAKINDFDGPPPSKKARLEKKEESSGLMAKGDAKAIVIDDESTEDEAEGDAHAAIRATVKHTQNARPKHFDAPQLSATTNEGDTTIKVLRLSWFKDSAEANKILPLDDYLVYRCRRIERPTLTTPEKQPSQVYARHSATKTRSAEAATPHIHRDNDILERAKEDAENAPKPNDRFGKRRFGHHQPATTDASWAAGHESDPKYAHLLHQTTTEHDIGYSSELPEMPDWVKAGVKYACQRSSPADSPNSAFIDQLKKIRLARTLTNDEIGVRAYSTSIASLSSYPYKLSNPREILALPGCEAKIANLYVEFANTGKLKAVIDVEEDEDLKVLRLFYEIWGVGAITAREFYYDRGWRDLDDIVEYGWSTLSRVQQIGVKYYDEFLDPIPRSEVEEIARIIHRHAVKVRDEGVQTLIVGGYRRGKAACGDVDLIVSHPDESQTLDIVNDIVASLEDEGWITHTLLLSLNNSKRNQETLPYRSREGPSGTHGGFDTLDKALVVWQDPVWSTKEADLAANPKAKNPNIHRRVDIIITPWRTAGCAVMGWSGGTTFQRDLRRYAKNVKGWKFDSSGVRSRGNGEVMDLEGFHDGAGGRARTLVEAERRVFEGFGLEYREPGERCTG